MARFPYVYSLASGRVYYGSALPSNNQNNQPQYWTNQPQIPVTSNFQVLKNTAITGGVLGTIGAIGFLPTKTGNVWDKYLHGMRAIEEFSPGGILRTFQLSNVFSPLSSTVKKANYHITPELLANNPTYLEYLSRLIGGSDTKFKLYQQGVTFRGGKLHWGTGNELALRYSSMLLSAGHGTAQRIGAAYARNLGLQSNVPLEHFFANIQPRPELAELINPSIEKEAFQVIGGQSRLQSSYRYISAIGTEQVDRFNRLLNAQSDIPILKEAFGKLQTSWKSVFGKPFKLGVKETGGLRMFGKLGFKYGVGLTALTLGYQTLDWTARRSELLDDTVLDEGLTVAGATVGIKANLAISKIAEKLGLHSYREKQEEIAPGSTSLTKLAAFPIMGALAPIGGLYAYKTTKMASLIRQGLTPAAARETAQEAISSWKSGPLLEQVGNIFAKKGGLYSNGGILDNLIKKIAFPDKAGNLIYKGLGKLTPGKLGAAMGASIGLAMIAPFLPGALMPSQRPDELEALYSGRKEIAIRKGRGWLMGRSKFEGEKPITFLPHWFPRMRMRATERGLWGPEEDERSPISKWLAKETSYELELRHYYDRPYGLTGTFGEDLPLIGPLVGATIGRLIKPPRPMHESEFQGKGGEFLVPQPRYGERINTEIGQQLPGKPVSPYSPTQVAGEQIYRMCFTKDTSIRMADKAYKKINEIKINDEIWQLKQPKRVKNIFIHSQTEDEQLKEIQVYGDWRKLKVTDSHIVLALQPKFCSAKTYNCIPNGSRESSKCKKCKNKLYQKYQLEWIPVKELKKWDYLIQYIPKAKDSKKELYLPDILNMDNFEIIDNQIYRRIQKSFVRKSNDYINFKGTEIHRKGNEYSADYIDRNAKTLPLSIPLNWDFGWLCGYSLAEGSPRAYQVSYAAHIDELDSHFKKLFDLMNLFFNEKEIRWIVKKDGEQKLTNGIEAIINHTSLAELLRSLLGIPSHKKINSILLNSNKEFLLGLLNGFIDGDFHIREKELSCNQSNQILQEQLRDIFFSLGIQVNTTYVEKTNGIPDKLYYAYGFNLYRNEIFKLRQLGKSGFKLSKDIATGKTKSTESFLEEYPDYYILYKKIKSIKNLPSTDFLYDLEIEDNHHYYAEDCVVHNSEMVGLPGFIESSIKEKLTGTQDWFDQFAQLETSRRMGGSERNYWDRELGDIFGTSETIRRFFPHRRRGIDLYNPITNTQPCLLPDTEVLMADGKCKRAEDIKIGEKLISHKGEEVFVENIGKFPTSKVVHLSLYGDNFHKLDFSPNHPILTDELIFKNAEDIRKGDYVAFPIRNYEKEIPTYKIDISNFLNINCSKTDKYLYYGIQSSNYMENEIAEKYKFKIKEIPLEIKHKYPKLYKICNYRLNSNRKSSYKRILRNWDIEDFYYLIGVYITEGSVFSLRDKSFKLSGHKQDKWEERIKNIFNKYEIKYSIEDSITGTGRNFQITNPILFNILRDISPGHAKEKYITENILNHSNPEIAIKSLIKALIDGDGCYFKTKSNRIRCQLKTTSKNLAYQFRNLVIDVFHFAPSITHSVFKEKESFHISLSGLNANILAKEIGYQIFDYTPKQNNNKQYSDNSYIYIKVKKVLTEEKDTYVIGHQVAGDHTFCVSLIATHNTWMPGAGDKSPDFRTGDPMVKIPFGEMRLPGPGIEARYPELEGVAPEDYKPAYRYKILCLDAKTLVITDSGMKSIQTILETDQVIGEDGQYHSILSKIHNTRIDDKYKLYTFYNFEPLICSAKHKILTSDKSGNITEKEAQNITQNDYLVFPKSSFGNKKNLCIGDYCNTDDVNIQYIKGVYSAKAKGSQNFIPFNLEVNYNLGFIFGLYLAEGGISRSTVITFTFNIEEKNTIAKKVEEFCNQIELPYTTRETTTNSYQIIISNRLLARFLGENFGYTQYTHHIKLDYLNYSKEFVQGIFDGHFNGDGYMACTQSTINGRSTSVCKGLIENLRLMGLMLNINGAINLRKGKYIGQQGYTFDIQRRDLKKIKMDKIHLNYIPKYKESQSNKYNFENETFRFVRVSKIEIEEQVNCDWYDIAIDGINNIHRFVTSQGLVHNSDVAPYSDAFKTAKLEVMRARKMKSWTERDEELFTQATDQLKEKKQGQQFQEYQYLNEMGGLSDSPGKQYASQLLTEINETQKKGISFNQSTLKNTIGSYWELLSHNAETALDQLTPVSPGAKLVHQRSAIESYERTQLYGQSNAFWQHPVKDFLAPFARSVSHAFGYEGESPGIREKRDIESYFDVLKYMKASRLANIARQAKDEEAVKEFETQKDQTLFGINPFTRRYGDLLRALPRAERDYLGAFEKADTYDERAKILKMVPENERGLYLARWKLTEADEIRRAQKAGILSQDQLKQADKELEQFYGEAKTEGFPSSKELFAEYSATRSYNENYGDWYRRIYLLPKIPNLPGSDWVGFTPQVDLEDIKMKVVKEHGKNIHDYNLWESREKQLAYKSYINEEVIAPIMKPNQLSIEERKSQINDVLLANEIKGSTFIRRDKTSNNSIDIHIEQNRDKEKEKLILKALD